VVAFSGLFYRWHGVQALAEAFVRLAERRPEAHVLLIGDGEERATMVEKLRAAGMLDRRTITGLVSPSAVPGYLAASDIRVSPHADLQRFVGSPIKIFEYMASGRATTASDLAQLGELLEHERTALLVPPGDVDALVTAIDRLIDGPTLRARLGTAARREAEREHSWDARVAGLLQPREAAGHSVSGNPVGTAEWSRGTPTPCRDANTMPVQT
jgi:glycosyltransferase involved in cell wall biosynthesis